jgi:hypothetical protein
MVFGFTTTYAIDVTTKVVSTPVSSTNKFDSYGIAKLLLNVALSTVSLLTYYNIHIYIYTLSCFAKKNNNIVLCFCFVFFFHLVYAMFPVSLECPFLIAPSVFSSVYGLNYTIITFYMQQLR